MLDIQKIRENKEEIRKALLKRLEEVNLDELINLDDQRKEIITRVEGLMGKRNKFSKTKPDSNTIKEMKSLGKDIKKIEEELNKVSKELKDKLSELPNIPADDVLPGDKENNKIIDTFGKKTEFKFEAKDHVELSTSLGLIDYVRAVKISGSGYWAYIGDGALLEWALLNYFIDFHRKNNYKFIIPPFILTEESAYVSGHLPKFKDDLYWTQDKTCLNATSEMMLGNYHRDEILEELPIKYYAFSPCFRREAGGYGANEKGMIRGHQFNKIEMFILTKPEDSWNIFDELLNNAKELLEGLDLHYNTVQLAAKDCSAAMAKTIDLEVYIPSMNGYKEVSSISNALDYQSRRGNIKYKDQGINKYLHTLNASGLATSRIIPAILEQYQQKDGSVKIPKVLQKYMNKKVIKK